MQHGAWYGSKSYISSFIRILTSNQMKLLAFLCYVLLKWTGLESRNEHNVYI